MRQEIGPKWISEATSFMEHCSYYRRYIFGFAAIAKPLHQLKERNRDFKLNSEAQQPFQQLKHCIVSLPTLVLFFLTKSIILFTATNQIAIGAVPAQAQIGLEQLTNYASIFLSKTQSRYLTRKFIILETINYTRQFRHLFLGELFMIFTDQIAFQWL